MTLILVLLPLFTLVLLFGLWWRAGREPPAECVVPRWDPPVGIRPGPAGALVDQRADPHDVVATILDLAVRGHIRIREIEQADTLTGRAFRALGVDARDWELELQGSDRRGLKLYERLVLDAIFDDVQRCRLSELSGRIRIFMGEIRRAIYSDLVRQRLFARSPEETRRRWLFLGLAIFVAGLLILAFGPVSYGVGVLISGGIVMLFSRWMPVVTPEGLRVRREILGFREYICRAEKAELEFRDAPARTPERFSVILPFAVALEASDLWMRQFARVLSPAETQRGAGIPLDTVGDLARAVAGFEVAASRLLRLTSISRVGSTGGRAAGGDGR